MENQRNPQFENINNALPSAEQINFNPPESWYDSPDIPDFTPGLDPEYVKMLEHYQPIIEQYAVPLGDDISSPVPSVKSETNPQGNGFVEEIDRLFSSPISNKNKLSVANPIAFSAKKTQFDRYYNHPNFARLGFHPYSNNEEYYNANSTVFADARRMLTQFANLVGSSVSSTYRSYGDLFGSDPYTTPDIKTSDEFESAMGIGMSTRGGVVGFTNNLFLNFGYTFGIIASVAVEEALLAGASALTGGGAAPVAGARTVTNIGRVGRAVGNSLMNSFGIGRLANATRQLTQNLNRADNARTFWQATRSGEWGVLGTLFLPETMAAVKKLQTAKTAGKSLSDIAKMSTLFGGFYREIRAINYAMSESKLESGSVFRQQLANGLAVEEMKEMQGLEPNLALVGENAQKAAFATTMMNFGLIYMSNKLVLDTAFAGFSRSLAREISDQLPALQRRVIQGKRTINPDGSVALDVFEDAGTGIRGTIKRVKAAGTRGAIDMAVGASLKYFAANLAEGIQEVGQEAISHGTKEYFTKLQDKPLNGGADLLRDTIGSALNSQMSAQGIETFLSGFLMGGLAKGPQKLIFETLPNVFTKITTGKDYNKMKNEAVAKLVEAHNELWNKIATDPNSVVFDLNKVNFLIQQEAANGMKKAEYTGDVYDFLDHKDLAKFQQVHTLMVNGTAHLFRQQLQDYLNLTDEELVQAFPTFREEAKSGKIRERVNDMLVSLDKAEENYRRNKDKLINPYDPNKYKKNTIEYYEEAKKYQAFEHVRYLQMYTENSFNRALERANKIYGELASDTIIGKLQANDLTLLLDDKAIEKEIKLLKAEINVLDESDENQKIKEEKRGKIEKLQKLKEVFDNEDNFEENGSFNKNRMKELLEPFKEYVQFLADTRDDFVDPARVEEVLTKITDHRALGNRALLNNKALQFLAAPENFDLIYQRQLNITKTQFENNKKNYEERVKHYVEKLEANQLLNELNKLGVYPDARETQKFLLSGNSEFLETFFTESGIVTENSGAIYFVIQELIKNYNEASKKEKTETTEDSQGSTEGSRTVNQKEEEEREKEDESKKLVIDIERLGDDYHPTLLDALHARYSNHVRIARKQGEVPLTKEDWQKSDDYNDLIASYKFIKTEWRKELESQARRKEDIEKDFLSDNGLLEWLTKTETIQEPLMINNYSDTNTTLMDFFPEAGFNRDMLANQDIRYKGANYNIVAEAIVDENGGFVNTFIIKNKNGTNLREESNDELLKDNEGRFFDLNAARQVLEKLEEKYYNENEPIEFQYGEFTLLTGGFVYSNVVSEDKYEVLSTAKEVQETGVLRLKSVKDDKIITIKSPEEFKENYQLDIFKASPVSKKMTRLRINDPVRHIPHENDGEDREQAVKRIDYIFSNLTPEERRSLELVVIDNPNSGATLEEEFAFDEKEPNPQLRKTSDTYIIGIRISDPALRDRINRELEDIARLPKSDSKDGIIAYIPNRNFAYYNSKGEQIDPRNMDLATARRMFYNYNQELTQADLDTLKQYFVIQASLISLVESKKSPKDNAEAEQQRQTQLELEKRRAEIDAMDDPEDKKTAEIKFMMEMLFSNVNINEAAAAKIKEYGDRIIAGEPVEQVTQGLGENFINSINTYLVSKGYQSITEESTEDVKASINNTIDQDTEQQEGPLIITSQELAKAGFTFNIDSRFFEKEADAISPRALNVNTVYIADEADEAAKNRFLIFDNRRYIFVDDEGNLISERRAEYITDEAAGIADLDFATKIEDEIQARSSDAHTRARNKGAYVLIVKHKSGEYTFVELKPKKLDDKELEDFFDEIIERSEKTIQENLNIVEGQILEKAEIKEGGLPYNNDFNKSLQEEIYIVAKPNMYVRLTVSPRGRIELQVFRLNKENKFEALLVKDGVNSPASISYLEMSEAIEEYKKNGKDKLDVLTKLFNAKLFNDANTRLEEFDLNLSMDSVRRSFPKEATIDEVLDNTETNHSTEVRYEYQVTLSQASPNVQAAREVSLIVNQAANKKEEERKQQEERQEEKNNKEEKDDQKIDTDEKLTNEDYISSVLSHIQEYALNEIANLNKQGELLINTKNQILDLEAKENRNNEEISLLESLKEIEKETQNKVDLMNIQINLINSIYNYVEGLRDDNSISKEKKEEIIRDLVAREKILFENFEFSIAQEDTTVQEDVNTETNEESAEEDTTKEKTKIEKITELKNKLKQLKLDHREKPKTDEYNQQVKELKDEITRLTKEIANKIVKGAVLDEIDVEDINDFLDWAAKNLPDYIDIEDINTLGNNMKSGGMRVGAFALALSDIAGGMRVKGTLYTGAKTPYRYHEAFHAVFRMLLTDEQQKKYLRLAAKEVRAKLRKEGISFEKALNEFSNLTERYKQLSREELIKLYYEEYLADQFELFKQSPKSTKTDPINKSFFARLVEWIKAFFSRFTKNELTRLYENIDSGKFKTAKPVLNRFTLEAEQGVSIKANAIIPYSGIDRDTYNYLDPDVASSLVRSIASIFIERESYNTDPNMTRNQLLDEIIADFKSLYDPDGTRSEDYKKLSDESWLILDNIFEAFSDYSEFFKQEVVKYLSLVDIKIEDSIYLYEEQEDDEGLRTVSDWDKDASNYGGWNSISSMLRKFIMTTSLEESDIFGNKELKPGENLVVPVDFAFVYNGLLKSTANETDPEKILKKIILFSQFNNHTKAVVDKILNRLGITEEQITDGNWTNSIKDPFFYNALISGFENFRVDYLFVHRNVNGQYYIYTAALRDDANSQIDRWGQAHLPIYERYIRDKDFKKQALDVIERFQKLITTAFKTVTDEDLRKNVEDIRAKLIEYTGIELSSQYIAYLITKNISNKTDKQNLLDSAYSNVDALTPENFVYMKKSISTNKNMFSTDITGAGIAIKKMAIANAEFDETVGASVFKNPNGDLVYAHQKSSFHLKMMQLLNNEDLLNELKKDPFLELNWLLNNEAFYQLAREKGISITRVAGLKQGRIEQTDESFEEYQTVGKTYGDLSPREFLAVLVNTYPALYNETTGKLKDTVQVKQDDGTYKRVALAPVLLRVLEASNTGDMAFLPVVETVKFNDKGQVVLTDKALDGFINNIKSEFERIKKNVNPKTRDQRNIENYNKGAKRAQIFGKNRSILTPKQKNINNVTQEVETERPEKYIPDELYERYLKISNKLQELYPQIKLNITENPDFLTDGGNVYNQLANDEESKKIIHQLTGSIKIANKYMKLMTDKKRMTLNTTANVLISNNPLKYLFIKNNGNIGLRIEDLADDIVKEIGDDIIPSEAKEEAQAFIDSINNPENYEKEFQEYKKLLEEKLKKHENKIKLLTDTGNKTAVELFNLLINNSKYIDDGFGVRHQLRIKSDRGKHFVFYYSNGELTSVNIQLFDKEGKYNSTRKIKSSEQNEAMTALNEFKNNKDRVERAIEILILQNLRTSYNSLKTSLNSKSFKQEVIKNLISEETERIEFDPTDILTGGVLTALKNNLITNEIINQDNDFTAEFGFNLEEILELINEKEYKSLADKKRKLIDVFNNQEQFKDDVDSNSNLPGWFLNAVSIEQTGEYFNDLKSPLAKGVIKMSAEEQYNKMQEGNIPKFQNILSSKSLVSLLTKNIKLAKPYNLDLDYQIFNQTSPTSRDNQVEYRLKSIQLLSSEKAKQLFKKGEKIGWDLNKILTELQIPKEQKQIILDSDFGGMYIDELSLRENIILNLSYYNTFVVEINTVKKSHSLQDGNLFTLGRDEYYKLRFEEIYYKNDTEISKEEYLEMKEKFLNTKYDDSYSRLTVQGGTNYRINEISTPSIEPNILGHAVFSTDTGIGWFRSDDQAKLDSKYPTTFTVDSETWTKKDGVWYSIYEGDVIKRDDLTDDDVLSIYETGKADNSFKASMVTDSKTRRILEMQSDLFQKGRNEKDLINDPYIIFEKGDTVMFEGVKYEVQSFYPGSEPNFSEEDNVVFPGEPATMELKNDTESIKLYDSEIYSVIKTKKDSKQPEDYKNDFLQLLNKKGRWVNFFIQSILQDSVKKGYEKVLFPNENTIVQIESAGSVKTVEQAKKASMDNLVSTSKFYGDRLSNILKKSYNAKEVTDEYGNKWNEVTLTPEMKSEILLQTVQKENETKIIGQAIIEDAEKMIGTILIDLVNQRVDTIPHEYAHFFIAKFRNSDIVQEAIKKWGSEEALVQSIGEQAVKQEGEAWGWWKSFVEWIKKQFSKLSDLDKQELTNILTDAFLTDENVFELDSLFENNELRKAQAQNSNQIYDSLDKKKTEFNNVVIKDAEGRGKVKNQSSNSIIAYRTRKNNFLEALQEDNAIGNPFSHKGYSMFKSNPATVEQAVKDFISWMIGESHTDKLQEYRQAIIDKIINGELQGKTIYYYTNLGEPSHATALDYLINNYNWNRAEAQQTEEYVSFEDYASINQDTEDTQETKMASEPKMLKDWATAIETIITENNDLSFEEVIEQLGGMEEFKEFLINRLEQEYLEFKKTSKEILADNFYGKHIKEGLKNSDGKLTTNVIQSMSDLNMTDNYDYNLKQIFFNNWLNVAAINQILKGDRALLVKNSTEEIKRAKGSNAAGDTAATAAIAEEFGIMHETKHISMFSFQDPENTKSYGEGPNVQIADGQTYGTIKAFKHFWFGLGKLTPKQERLLQRIENGEEIPYEELLESAEDGQSYAKMQAMMNSKKFVYDDGKIYLKTSIFFLTKEYTSYEEDGIWKPKPNKIALHNLRISMEKFEEKEWAEGRGTVALAAPASALKKLKMNVQTFEDATSGREYTTDNRMDMDASYMRLQTINPSNKMEITDPSQIRTLITAEQYLSDNQKESISVVINGKSYTIKEVKAYYNQALTNRDTLNYTTKRNLIFRFDIDKATELLDKSIKANRLLPELYTFLMYAAAGLEASNATSNILEMFSVDENGQQKYNLNNPQTVRKFEQLFLSFFSKGVMNAKIPGTSAALVSDMGVRVYRKVYSVDENGMPDRQEVIRENDFHKNYDANAIEYNIDNGPIAGDDKNLSGLAKAVAKGRPVIIIDRLRANMKEYVKVEKDKYQYTGQRYSEMIMAPHEINMAKKFAKTNQPIPDFLSKIFSVRIPSQDKHSFMNIKWVDFMPGYYGSSAVVARELIEISGADFDIDKLYMHMKAYFYENGQFYEYGNVKNDKEGFRHYVKSLNKNVNKKGSTIALALEKYNADPVLGFDIEKVFEDVKEYGISVEAIKAAAKLGLPYTYNAYVKYKEKYKEEPYTEAINNRILDFKYALLGNEHITNTKGRNVAIQHEPADTKPLNELLNILKEEIPEIAELISEEDIDIDNMLNSMKAFDANKAGANSIGAAVLPNLYLSLLKEYDISIPMVINENGRVASVNLYLNNQYFNSFGGNMAGENRKQYIISALITAMTDNAKLRLSKKLGLNKDALAVVANMTGLGVPIRTSILLINNPIIQELYFKAINKENASDPGIKFLTAKMLSDIAEVFDSIEDEKKGSLKIKVTDKILLRAWKNKLDTKNILKSKNYEDIKIAYNILDQFMIALKIKDYTSKLGSIMSLTKGPGKTYLDILRKEVDIRDLGLNLSNSAYNIYYNSRLESKEIVIDVRPIFNNTWQGNMLKIFQEIKDKLLARVFITRTEPFVNMLNKIYSNLGNLSQEDKERVRLDLLSYLTLKAYDHSLQTSGNRHIASFNNNLLYPQLEGEKITEVVDRMRTKHPNNFFLRYFAISRKANSEGNRSGIDTVMANTFNRLSDSAKIKLQTALVNLSNQLNVYDDFRTLIHYMMVKDGMGYAYGSLLEAVTPYLYENYLNVIDGVENTLLNFEEGNVNATFGITSDELMNNFLLGYLQNVKLKGKIKKFRGAGFRNVSSFKNTDIIDQFNLNDIASNQDTLYLYTGESEVLSSQENTFELKYKKNNGMYFNDSELNQFRVFFARSLKDFQDKFKNLGYERLVHASKLIPDYNTIASKSPDIAKHIKLKLDELGLSPISIAGSKFFYIRTENNTTKLIIDLYPEVETEILETDPFRSKREGLAKDNLEKKIYGFNKSSLAKKNNIIIGVVEEETGKVLEIVIPYAIRLGSDETGYTYYILNKYKTSSEDDYFDSSNITANYAEYVKFSPKGSYSQWAGGFMFQGELPSYTELMRYNENKEEREFKSEPVKANMISNVVDQKATITKEKSTSSPTNDNKNTEKAANDVENTPPPLDDDWWNILMSQSQEEDSIKEIDNFWNELSVEKKNKLTKDRNMKNHKETLNHIKKEFKKGSVNIKDYLETLKKCFS